MNTRNRSMSIFCLYLSQIVEDMYSTLTSFSFMLKYHFWKPWIWPKLFQWSNNAFSLPFEQIWRGLVVWLVAWGGSEGWVIVGGGGSATATTWTGPLQGQDGAELCPVGVQVRSHGQDAFWFNSPKLIDSVIFCRNYLSRQTKKTHSKSV